MDTTTPEQIGTVVNLLQIGSWLEAELDRELRSQAGISHAEHEVLMQLLQHGSRLSMKELSELSLFTQSGITRVVDRLVHKRLVVRETLPGNRRVIYAVLTDAGRERLETAAMPLVRRIITNRFSRHLSDPDARALGAVLLTLITENGWRDERQVSHQRPPGEAARRLAG